MKYIRTKDGIYTVTGSYVLNNITYYTIAERISSISEEATTKIITNTIPELCDVFVFDDGEGDPLLCTYEELIYWFNHSKEEQYKTRNCYGAIWTPCGVEYVAKLNDNKEWELL